LVKVKGLAERTSAPSRREGILGVTFAHLVARGFEGLRIRDIAQAVGINQATLLYHFHDKEELIVALVDDLIARFRSVNEGRYTIETGSFAAFDAHLRTLGELFVTSPEMYVALNEIGARALRHPKIAAKIANVEENWAAYISTLLRAGIPNARETDISALAVATVVYVRGVNAKAAGDGTLAALIAREKGRSIAARRIRASIDAYAALVHRSFPSVAN
jgi:AcrR family transcriptional regulator